MSLRNYPKSEKRGSYRGAGAYSKDYAGFDRDTPWQYPGRDISGKVEGVGDYDSDVAFTGPIKGMGDKNRWPALADRQNTRGDGAYSKSGRRDTERPRKQSDGSASGGQKLSDDMDW